MAPLSLLVSCQSQNRPSVFNRPKCNANTQGIYFILIDCAVINNALDLSIEDQALVDQMLHDCGVIPDDDNFDFNPSL